MVNVYSLKKDGLLQGELSPRNTMKNNINNFLISDRSQPGLVMTVPTVKHWGVSDKYVTGVPKIKKIRVRENISGRAWRKT